MKTNNYYMFFLHFQSRKFQNDLKLDYQFSAFWLNFQYPMEVRHCISEKISQDALFMTAIRHIRTRPESFANVKCK